MNNFWAAGTFVSAPINYAYRMLPVFSLKLLRSEKTGLLQASNSLGPLGQSHTSLLALKRERWLFCNMWADALIWRISKDQVMAPISITWHFQSCTSRPSRQDWCWRKISSAPVTWTHWLQLMVFAHKKYLPSFLELIPPPYLKEVPILSVHH